MDAIYNNPFRVLGLKTTASDREIAKRISDLLLYAEMGKEVRYESDMDFLGEVDRSLDNIKEAAKRLENNDLKLFYSLMWFEIKDEVDKQAIKYIENSNFANAIKILEDNIFFNTTNKRNRYNYNTENLQHVNWKTNFQAQNAQYSIENIRIRDTFTSNTIRSEIKTNGNNQDIFIIEETRLEVPYFKKFRLGCDFSYETNTSSNNLSFCFLGNNILNTDFSNKFTINTDGILKFQASFELDDPSQLEYKEIKLDNFAKDKIQIEISYIENAWNDGYIDIWINNNFVIRLKNYLLNMNSFWIEMSGNQTIKMSKLSLFELNYQYIKEDIELNDITYSYIKNLALINL